MVSYYNTPGARALCHALKQSDDRKAYNRAVSIMAEYLSGQGVDKNDLLIPCPQHTGSAVYTKEIAERIACLTGATVADILKCVPRETLYTQKRRGLDPDPLLYLKGTLSATGNIYLVDNVIGTGKTLGAARAVLGQYIKPLVFAIDETKAGKKGGIV